MSYWRNESESDPVKMLIDRSKGRDESGNVDGEIKSESVLLEGGVGVGLRVGDVGGGHGLLPMSIPHLELISFRCLVDLLFHAISFFI